MIQSYLLNTAYQLRDENNSRGERIINEIEISAQGSLSIAFAAKVEQENDDLEKQINDKISTLNLEKQEEGREIIDVTAWKATFPQYIGEIDLLHSVYQNTFEKSFEGAVGGYNKMIDSVDKWKQGVTDYAELSLEIEQMLVNMGTYIDELTENGNIGGEADTEQGIDGLNSFNVYKDANVLSSAYKQNCISLIGEFNSLKTRLEDLKKSIDELNSLHDNGNLDELNKIIADIYLLDINGKNELAELINRINDLAIEASGANSLSSEEVQKIISLKDYLVGYQKYLDLKEKLDIYCNENMGKTYRIDSRTDTNMPETGQELDNSEGFSISEQEWLELISR